MKKLFYFLLIACMYSCEVANEKIEIGGIYLHSYNWDEKDPFEQVEIDTVKVIAIRRGYVQWLPNYKEDWNAQSMKLEYFKENARPLHQNKNKECDRQ